MPFEGTTGQEALLLGQESFLGSVCKAQNGLVGQYNKYAKALILSCWDGTEGRSLKLIIVIHDLLN